MYVHTCIKGAGARSGLFYFISPNSFQEDNGYVNLSSRETPPHMYLKPELNLIIYIYRERINFTSRIIKEAEKKHTKSRFYFVLYFPSVTGCKLECRQDCDALCYIHIHMAR